MPTLKYFKIHPEAPEPVFATNDAACFDLHASWKDHTVITIYDEYNEKHTRSFKDTEDIPVYPGWRVLVPTGLIFDIPEGYSVRLHVRSGIALKEGLTLGNAEGVIDADYVHQTFAMLHNTSKTPVYVKNNTRVAQGELVKMLHYDFEEVFEAPQQKTNRTGGLGSTGK